MSDRLEGHDEIRKYIDPNMSESYYFKKIRPHLDGILIKRSYHSRKKKGNSPQYFTFTNLVQAFLLRLKEL